MQHELQPSLRPGVRSFVGFGARIRVRSTSRGRAKAAAPVDGNREHYRHWHWHWHTTPQENSAGVPFPVAPGRLGPCSTSSQQGIFVVDHLVCRRIPAGSHSRYGGRIHRLPKGPAGVASFVGTPGTDPGGIALHRGPQTDSQKRWRRRRCPGTSAATRVHCQHAGISPVPALVHGDLTAGFGFWDTSCCSIAASHNDVIVIIIVETRHQSCRDRAGPPHPTGPADSPPLWGGIRGGRPRDPQGRHGSHSGDAPG
mmetsp:Transcript_6304/g.17978  ORF Transcript_6304/g.17978 Transcript_6304/m.17978 type:complete len:255 (+) Transcript_6304:835-1599(+)